MKHTVCIKLTFALEITDEAALIATATAQFPEVEEPFDLDTALLFLLTPDVEFSGPGAKILEVGFALAGEGGQ